GVLASDGDVGHGVFLSQVSRWSSPDGAVSTSAKSVCTHVFLFRLPTVERRCGRPSSLDRCPLPLNTVATDGRRGRAHGRCGWHKTGVESRPQHGTGPDQFIPYMNS